MQIFIINLILSFGAYFALLDGWKNSFYVVELKEFWEKQKIQLNVWNISMLMRGGSRKNLFFWHHNPMMSNLACINLTFHSFLSFFVFFSLFLIKLPSYHKNVKSCLINSLLTLWTLLSHLHVLYVPVSSSSF